MGLLPITLFLIITTHSISCTITSNSMHQFEFGQNIGQVAFSVSGSIGLLEKTKRIAIVVPECSVLTYVYVEVYNPFWRPDVKFNRDLSSVVISYSLLQHSGSQYSVIAKAIPSAICKTNVVPYNTPKLIPVQYLPSI